MRYIKVAFDEPFQLIRTQIHALSAEKKGEMNIIFCIFVNEWFSEILLVIPIKMNMYWSRALKIFLPQYCPTFHV
jgi:hypothetical protein